MPAKTALTKISPTLTAFAVLRTGDVAMVGRYCHERDVWIVDGAEGSRPIVELRTDIAETSTFTKVLAEQDDTDVSPALEAATHTGTFVSAEADDQDNDRLANTLLMVTTKTDANVERDDVAKTLLAFELQSSPGVSVGGNSHPLILIVTNERDLTTDYVVLELQRRGCSYVRLNTESMASRRVTLGFADRDDWSIALSDRTLRGGEVTAAYFRRPGSPSVDAGVEDPGERAYCEAEWGALLKSLYMRIGERWLNEPSNIMLAEDKPRQLLLARSLGFKVPEALVTNDMEAADQFLSGPQSIAKPLREALLDGETERVIFTSRVARASLRDARAFGAAPMILQREIAKRADVRVTVVGDCVFAAAIYSQGNPETEVDWRRGGSGDLPYQAISLPGPLSALCVQLVKSLDLRFGAIDLVWDENGVFWFLEINPNGQWAWIETRTGHPITAAIVDALERISAP